jgi:limonene-1,2-epoxide hydrolase
MHMARKSIEERIQKQEQARARLAQADAKLQTDERRTRIQRLIRAGALVEKAGLLTLDANAQYGAFLSLRPALADDSRVERWAADGGRAFAEEARQREEAKDGVILVFSTEPAKSVATALREAKFRRTILGYWEGRTRFEDAETLAAKHGGVAHKAAAFSAMARKILEDDISTAPRKKRKSGNRPGRSTKSAPNSPPPAVASDPPPAPTPHSHAPLSSDNGDQNERSGEYRGIARRTSQLN